MRRPDIAVVIPTRDRRATLLHTLDRLDAQDVGSQTVEVIVVDNGSTDGTTDAVVNRVGRWSMQVLQEPIPGPGPARNLGIRNATAPLILLLGDDMPPATNIVLAGHLAHHAAHPEATYAALGLVTWSPRQPVTPFMRWLDAAGLQFAFSRLAAGPVDVAKYFYTSQVSLKRELLLAEPFDERFPFVEDVELGLRLAHRGVTLDYRPELEVHHDHPTDVWRYAKRMELVGAACRLLHQLWPGEAPLPGPRPWWPLYPIASRLSDAALHAGLERPRLWSVTVQARYAWGYRNAAQLIPAVAP